MREREQGCRLCPRGCGVTRQGLRGKGFCGGGSTAVISRAALHFWEEPVISGTRGSGTVFFSGCTLGCIFCQNAAISAELHGRAVTPHELAEAMKSLEQEGAHNISFVTGTHYLPAIEQALSIYRPSVPLVWNSGGYETEETVRRLGEWVDIWLPDYKFALPELAKQWCRATDYPQIALKAIIEMCRLNDQRGGNRFSDGVMTQGVIVRHMVMPGHTRNSVAALRLLRDSLPDGTLMSLMSQYTPNDRVNEYVQYPELSRRITQREYDRVMRVADELGIEGFRQELSSAREEYVPPFDLSEVTETGDAN